MTYTAPQTIRFSVTNGAGPGKVDHTASFEQVRANAYAALGWAVVGDYRFPAIVVRRDNKQGYTVYTVSDWQAPDYGDLSNPVDWAALVRTGTGVFLNQGPKGIGALDTRQFDLPLTEEDQAYVDTLGPRSSWRPSGPAPLSR